MKISGLVSMLVMVSALISGAETITPPSTPSGLSPLSLLPPRSMTTLFVDNDGFGGTDLEYSSGLRLAHVLDHNHAGKWKGLSLTHEIYTPPSFYLNPPSVYERPFAAWLSLGYGHGVVEDGHTRAFEWSLGVVGELALGEPIQDIAHTYVEFEAQGFRGWDGQIPSEPVFNLFYEEEWRVYRVSALGIEADLWLGLNGELGTYSTGVGTSATLRAGWNLSPYKSAERLAPTAYRFSSWGDEPSAYFFTSIDLSYLPHQLTLEGGVFRDFQTEIDPNSFHGEWATGFVYDGDRYALSIGYVIRAEEYQEQDGSHQYGFFSISYRL